MTNILYNMAELIALEDIQAQEAVRSCGSGPAYFDQLGLFIEEAPRLLQGYTASVVIFSPDEQKKFLAELTDLSIQGSVLGISFIERQISFLRDAVQRGDANTLEDGIMGLQIKLGDLATRLEAAQLTPPPPKAQQEQEFVIMSEVPTILAVDDRPEILTSITGVLKDNFKVLGVTNGSAAIKAAIKHNPALFLLDIEMPDMSGYLLTELIRIYPQFIQTPILFLTGNSSKDCVLTALQHGGNDYILKPVNRETLLNRVNLHLKRM